MARLVDAGLAVYDDERARAPVVRAVAPVQPVVLFPNAAPSTTAPAWDGSFWDPLRLNEALAAQAPGADGRTVLSDPGWLFALNPLSGITLKNAARAGYTSYSESADYWVDDAAAVYTDKLGRNYRELSAAEKGPGDNRTFIQYFQNNGGGFENPTGNASDRVQPIYLLGANGTATPHAANTGYVGSEWVRNGRDVAKLVAVAATAYFGGAALAAAEAGAGTGAAAATAAASEGSALTFASVEASTIGSGLGIEGFGAGLGTATGTGAGIGGGIGGAFAGSALIFPELTFASLGAGAAAAPAASSSIVDSTVGSAAQAAPAASSAVPEAASAAAPAATSTASLGSQIASGANALLGAIKTAAGVVGAVAAIDSAINPKTDQKPAGSAPSASQPGGVLQGLASGGNGPLLLLAGALGLFFFAS